MTAPDAMNAVRRGLLDQAGIATASSNRVYAYKVPRAVVDAGLERAIILVRPSGRSPSVGDRSRALIGRPRFDLWHFGASVDEAGELYWLTYEWLKELSRVRVALTDGDALIHDAVVEGGPLHFDDPDSDAPVVMGVYSVDVAEEYLPDQVGS